ncbi:hypothetical protein VTN77DRAFT_2276 [Rasamsonia byssochlamydoides]|uniref:uncharacterized protein n=1 Tax=Rasamsonia byssochlamydoides TaxID=89139 RepID=UPI0037426BAD
MVVRYSTGAADICAAKTLPSENRQNSELIEPWGHEGTSRQLPGGKANQKRKYTVYQAEERDLAERLVIGLKKCKFPAE